jgi:hypothetical protein
MGSNDSEISIEEGSEDEEKKNSKPALKVFNNETSVGEGNEDEGKKRSKPAFKIVNRETSVGERNEDERKKSSELVLKVVNDETSVEKGNEDERKKRSKPALEVVSLTEVCSDTFEENSDNKVLRFIILHIRKAQLKFVKTFSARQNKWNMNPNLSYDRIITCADISSEKGLCFCLIYSSQRESDFKLQKFKYDNCGVGEIGEIIEPLFSKKTLGSSDLPILEHKLPLNHISKNELLLKKIATVNYLEDALPNFGTKFFHMKNIQLHVQNLTVEDPICTGFMCDRQEMKGAEGTSCGCLIQSDGCNIVLSCNLYFRSKEGKPLFNVRNYRSWSLTKLLCGSSISHISTKSDYSDAETLMELRERMSVIVDYVNCAEGWSIFGWFRVGLLQDAADQAQDILKSQTELIAAETVTPHISRLWPADVNVSELLKFQMQAKKLNVPIIEKAKGCI